MKSFEHMFPGEDMRTVAKIVECLSGDSPQLKELSGSSGVSDAGWRLDYGSSTSYLGRLGGERDDTFANERHGYGEIRIDGVSYSSFDLHSSFQEQEDENFHLYEISEEGKDIEEDKEVFVERKVETVLLSVPEEKEKPKDLEEAVERLKSQAKKNGDWQKYEDLFKRLEELVREARQSLRRDIGEGLFNADFFLAKILVSDDKDIDFGELEEIIKAYDEKD